jgi:hypothetical protein
MYPEWFATKFASGAAPEELPEGKVIMRFTAITFSPVELGDIVTVVVMVLVETEVSVAVEVFDACPTAKYRLADISTPAITMAEAMAR